MNILSSLLSSPTSMSLQKRWEEVGERASQSRLVKVLGLLTATSTLYSVAHSFAKYLLPAACCSFITGSKSAFASYGAYENAYVLITGASDGIGKALALEAAAKGFHVILLSRSISKLESVKAEIQSRYPGTKVVLFSMDCSDQTQLFPKLHELMTLIEDLDVAMLWNNVAITTDTPVAVEHLTEDEIIRIQTCNTTFLASLTSKIIPKMRKRAPKKCIIVNISSFLSILPAANFTLYSATKAFVNQFTIALHCELEGSNIRVKGLRPAHVATNMSGIKESSLMVPTPQEWASNAWKSIRYEDSQEIIAVPYLTHEFQEWMATLFPAWFIRHSLRNVLVEPEERKRK